jgi:glycerol-3-phosphate dehydrogenase
MAGPSSLGPTEQISTDDLKRRMPQVNARGLRGGVRYWDGQFDDAGMALALARTASSWGALTINHCEVTELVHTAGRVTGLVCRDAETGESATLQARCVINATGVWVDRFRHDKGRPSVTVSQGVHLVVDRRFWPHDQALLIPRTRDGRVLFVVPWLGHVILGTTDTPRSDHPIEPQAQDSDVTFILEELARYLEHPPGRADITSVWAGLRPLVRPDAQSAASASQTRAISREHAVWVDTDDLVSVTGGKWTTYRSMAEDVMRHCRAAGLLPASDPTQTTVHLPLLERDQDALQALPGATRPLCPELSEADVRYAVRYDFARTVEDVLARRTRLLFLDAALARRLAPQVAEILISEGVTAPDLEGFMTLSRSYELS